MPSFADFFYYDQDLDPIVSLSLALMVLRSLFQAKLDGVIETGSMPLLRGFATKPTTSIDDDIKEYMEMIRSCPEFSTLSDKNEAFIYEWRGLEDMFEIGELRIDMAVRDRLRDLLDAFWSEQGSFPI